MPLSLESPRRPISKKSTRPHSASGKLLVILLGMLTVVTLAIFGSISSKAERPEALTGLSALNGIGPIPDKPVAAPVSSPVPRKKFAVIIGIVYDNSELGSVNFADRDATAVYTMLTQQMGFPNDNVKLLRNGEATNQNINSAINWLISNPEIDANSDVVFYYSGHGLKTGNGMGVSNADGSPSYALVPIDYRFFNYGAGQGLFSDAYLADRLSQINPGRMWITIDSCFSGGYIRPGIAGNNRIVTVSSRNNQLSGEINETGSGVLTQLMINDGIARGLSIEEAFQIAAGRAAQPYGQDPMISDNFSGNMDLRPSVMG